MVKYLAAWGEVERAYIESRKRTHVTLMSAWKSMALLVRDSSWVGDGEYVDGMSTCSLKYFVQIRRKDESVGREGTGRGSR